MNLNVQMQERKVSTNILTWL